MKDRFENFNEIYKTVAKGDLKSPENKYPKKDFEELICLLKQKNIKFNLISESEAFDILHDVNYYYKLTVYKRNFKKDDSGKFINLDFSYLNSLASVDMQLRYLLLNATLDIEHALKTFLISNITKNPEEDGFEIVRRFFHSTTGTRKPLSNEIILRSVKNKSDYQYKLYKTHKNAMPAWVLMEVINFGDFLRFFEFYFRKEPTNQFDISSLMGVLNSVKRIRNASAHNNAFLFDLHESNINHVSKYIKEYSKDLGVGELFYKCNKIHDVLCVFYIHNIFVKGKGSRHHRTKEFKNLSTKSRNRFRYMKNEKGIFHFFEILNIILDEYEI